MAEQPAGSAAAAFDGAAAGGAANAGAAADGAGAGLPRLPWPGFADEAEYARWLPAAEQVAARLAPTAVERDAAGGPPFDEVGALREAGLLQLLVPAAEGGAGAHWSTALAAVRLLAAVDASAAQLYANHLLNQACVALVAAPAERSQWYAASVAGDWFWAAATNPGDPPIALRAPAAAAGEPAPSRFRLDGAKRYATGAPAAEVLVVAIEDAAGALAGWGLPSEPGARRLAVIPADRQGVVIDEDWDRIGQRRTGSGAARFEGVVIERGELLGDPAVDVVASLIAPLVQLAFANLDAGIGRGALAAVAALTAARTRPLAGGETAAAEDPLVHRLLGSLDARLTAAEALLDALGARLEALLDRLSRPQAALEPVVRADFAIAVSRAKVAAVDAALAAATESFEALGASGTERALGLDRPWRDLRTHSLHDSLEHHRRRIGAALLGAAAAPPTLYS